MSAYWVVWRGAARSAIWTGEAWTGEDWMGEDMGDEGYVAILTVELHFPAAASLKGKRHFVRSARDTLRGRFGASVAEVAHHDLWQRASLLVACAARDAHEAERLADGAERWLASGDWVLVRCERLLVSPADA
jgi:uncharacterized protein YlxP (DUF503 family)